MIHRSQIDSRRDICFAVRAAGGVNWTRFLPAVLSIAAGAFLSVPADEARCDPPLPTVQDIEVKWLARERGFRSLDVRWQEVSTERRPPEVGDAFSVDASHAPAFENRYERRLALAGKRLRYEDGMPSWYANEAAYVPDRRISVEDGRTAMSLIIRARPTGFPFQGSAGPSGSIANKVRSLIDLQPLLDHYRPTYRLLEVLRRSEITSRRGVIGNDRCVITQVRRKSGSGSTFYMMWLDAEGDFSVRRIVEELNGSVLEQQDRDYRVDPANGSLLDRWRTVRNTPAGEMKFSVDVTDANTVVNSDIPHDVFRLTFPERTVVIQQTPTGNAYRYVESNGSTRVLSSAELLNSSPEAIMGQTGAKRWIIRWAVGLSVATVILLVIVRLRWRSFRSV